MKSPNKKLRILAYVVLGLAVSGAALASTTGSTDFDAVTTRLQNWMEGSLGKTFALGSLAVGLAIGVVKQSVMSVVTGAAVALSSSIGPGVLNTVFSATL